MALVLESKFYYISKFEKTQQNFDVILFFTNDHSLVLILFPYTVTKEVNQTILNLTPAYLGCLGPHYILPVYDFHLESSISLQDYSWQNPLFSASKEN